MQLPTDSRLNRSDLAFLALLLAGFTAVATFVSFQKDIWLDETFTLGRTGTSLQHTLDLARDRSLKPPLYFVAVYFWRFFGDSIEVVRGLSTVSVALALVYLHRVSLALGIGRGWRSLAVVGALTPHLLWAAVEARTYGLTVLCLSACTYYFVRLWITGSNTPWRDNILFVLFGYAAILTFYYAGFILAGLFVAGLFGKDPRRLVWSGVALVLLLVPWLPQIADHVGQQGNYMAPLDLEGSDRVEQVGALGAWFFALPTEIVFRHVGILNRAGLESALMLLGLGLLGLRVGVGRPRWSRAETMLWVAAAVGVGLLAAIRVMNIQMMDLRHWSIAAPSLIVLPPLLASHLQPVWASRAAAAGLVALFALTAVSYARNEEGPRDVHGAAKIVAQRERPGEPLIFFTNPAPFEYYYLGPNPIRRLPVDPTAQPLVKPGAPLPPADRLHLLDLLAAGDTAAGSFWLVEGWERSEAAGIVEATLERRLVVLAQWQSFRITVTHVRLGESIAGGVP
ncbi:MAG: hypothetical protein OEW80_05130 [Gemmatimonadota bacterium]|nr:hypothetical protein [Gemmatimonadota bacterium]